MVRVRKGLPQKKSERVTEIKLSFARKIAARTE
jgi:hypothetical protein